ncbi:unnamed protein product, partial [Laminaria digitata]
MLRSAARLRGGGGPVARCCSGSTRPAAACRLQPLTQRRSLCAFANHSDSNRESNTRHCKGGAILDHPNAFRRRYHRHLSNRVYLPPTNSSRGGGGGGAIVGGFGRVNAENQVASAAGRRRQ